MTASILQTPLVDAEPVELSRTLYRKQVLKHGTIDYKGRKISFDKAYSTDLANAYKAGKFDQVPFVLATADNEHNSLPERFRGEVKGLIPTDDGLDMLLELTDDGVQIVKDNPRLGVSARIVEEGDHRAVEHVLGTLNPKLTGMRPWEAVELSSSTPGPILDLSTATYESEATVPELTEDEVAQFRALLAAQAKASEPEPKPEPAPGVIPAEAKSDDLSDEEIAALVDKMLAEEAKANETQPEPVAAGAELSAETKAALELAQANENERALELSKIRSELDQANYERDAAAYKAAGVPPKLVDLARPLLEGSGHVVDLSNGNKADAGAVIRAVLDECKGTVDLTGEHGASFLTETGGDQAAAAQDLVARFKAQYRPGGLI